MTAPHSESLIQMRLSFGREGETRRPKKPLTADAFYRVGGGKPSEVRDRCPYSGSVPSAIARRFPQRDRPPSTRQAPRIARRTLRERHRGRSAVPARRAI